MYMYVFRNIFSFHECTFVFTYSNTSPYGSPEIGLSKVSFRHPVMQCRSLHTHHFQQALQRLENMPEVDMQLQLFSAVDIQHQDWVVSQTLHADPFKKEKSRMVSFDIGEYVQILQYTNINCNCK